MKQIIFILYLCVSNWAQATPLNSQSQAEIEHLFDFLSKSGCEFQRNGSWYAAPKAAEHIRKKYDYLIKRDLINGADKFIELAASKSSLSGKEYQVKCADKATIPSAKWFTQELARYRAETQHSTTKNSQSFSSKQ